MVDARRLRNHRLLLLCASLMLWPMPQVAQASSVIVVPLSVRIDVLKKVLEEKVPLSESGSKDNVLGKPATSSKLSWTFDRAPIGLTAGNNALTASTSISGVVRIKGEAQIIRGDLGK